MVIAPHPDDEALGCGGTVMQHVDAGDAVTIVIVTDGRRSRAAGLEPEAMAHARRKEARLAMSVMGVSDLRWLGHPEGDWADAALEADLRAAVEALAPDLVYAPSFFDYHPEHRRVAGVLATVVPAGCTVRICTLHLPLNGLANVRVDVSADLARLEQVFSAYSTQLASLRRGLRLRAYSAAWHGAGNAVEEFWELPGAAYARAHSIPMPPPKVYGMRRRSFTDPLCYLFGRNGRRDILNATRQG